VLNEIQLEMFKCFEVLNLPLKPLTLLSGMNASGKSTVLQAMVLLHQTILDHEWSTRLQLDGSEIQLGTVGDILDKVHGRREFGLGLVDESCSVKWRFHCDDEKQSMSAIVDSVTVNGVVTPQPKMLRNLFPTPVTKPDAERLANRLLKMTYLTAERLGPRDSYPLQDQNAPQVVGPRGENAIGMLFQRQDQQVVDRLVVESEPSKLLNQVIVRMRQFFPNTMLDIQKVKQTNSVVLGIRTSDDTDFHRPINVGFGLTQVLPIIVGALTAGAGDLLLIENPEVHLHPAGQALMGQFLVEVAAAGIQVIAESHSDHVLNGIRRGIKSGKLKGSDTALHFFQPRSDSNDQVMTPQMDDQGKIDHWPTGFFDQFDKDLNYFAGWGG
jgi:predicted ATPase